jgi:hypothetical protein
MWRLALPVLGLLVAAAALGDEPKKPEPKFPLGKETTYVTGPLNADGYIDYLAALNEITGKGITPDKNANVLIWKALGPKPEGGTVPPAFFKALGRDEPPEQGDYFIDLWSFLKAASKLDGADSDAVADLLSRAGHRPWTEKDYPNVADWLKANEKPLAVIVEATNRPDYFNPLVYPKNSKGPGGAVRPLHPGVHKCREIAKALAARAMLRVGEGKFEDAWQDLLACHRLGRLVGRGPTLIEALVGIAIGQGAADADLAYLERARLTAKQVQGHLKELQDLPSLPPLADKIDLAERFQFLDGLQLLRCCGSEALTVRADGGNAVYVSTAARAMRKPDPKELEALAKVDWEPALRNGNRWYDRLAAALRIEDRAAREKELDKIDDDLRTLKKEAQGLGTIAKLVLEKDAGPKTAGKVIGDVLIGLLVPPYRRVQNAYERSEQVQRNLQVAFALAAYRSDNAGYPAKLAELAPKYLAEVPGDLFSGKALVYRPAPDGYLLYSVGVNGKDEEGRWTDDDPPGDDLRVRMPLPEPKPKK